MTFIHDHLRKRELNERGINMVDLMMWLVIAALLLAAALQSIGFYQRAAHVYGMSTNVDSIASSAIAIAAINSRTVGSADLQEAIAATKLQPGVTVTWGTIPVLAAGGGFDNGMELASAVTPVASVPAAANAGTVYALKAVHKDVSQKEVVYVFENTSSFKAGMTTVARGSFALNPYNDAPVGGGGSGSGGSSSGGSSVGTPVIAKILGQKATLTWASVTGATGYVVTAGAVTQNVSGGSTTTATLTLPTGFSGAATVKSIVGGVTSAASAPVTVNIPVHELTTNFNFAKAEITGSTGSTNDLVSAPMHTSLLSPNGRYLLTYRTDGDFILYDLTTNKAIQSTQTATPRKSETMIFQADGNLVAYDDWQSTYEAAIKATGTWGIPMPAKMTLEDSGSLKIRDSTGSIRYDSTILNGFLRAP